MERVRACGGRFSTRSALCSANVSSADRVRKNNPEEVDNFRPALIQGLSFTICCASEGCPPYWHPPKALQIVMLREYRTEEYVVVAREHSEGVAVSQYRKWPVDPAHLLGEALNLAGTMVSVSLDFQGWQNGSCDANRRIGMSPEISTKIRAFLCLLKPELRVLWQQLFARPQSQVRWAFQFVVRTLPRRSEMRAPFPPDTK